MMPGPNWEVSRRLIDVFVDRGCEAVSDAMVRELSARRVDVLNPETALERGGVVLLGSRTADGASSLVALRELRQRNPCLIVYVCAQPGSSVLGQVTNYARAGADRLFMLGTQSDVVDLVEQVLERIAAPPPETELHAVGVLTMPPRLLRWVQHVFRNAYRPVRIGELGRALGRAVRRVNEELQNDDLPSLRDLWRCGHSKVSESFVRPFALVAVAFLMGTSARPIRAQGGGLTRIELSNPTARVSGLERVRQVRELADGTLLVLEGRSATPLLVELGTGTSRMVSRVGDGPGEFRQPSALIALSGDSTAVVDLHRWVILDGTRPVATLRAWLAGMYPPRINGVDERGRVLEVKPAAYGAQPGTRVTPTHQNATVLLVLLHRRAEVDSGRATAGAVDTIARLRGAFRGVRRHTIRRPRRPIITYELVQELATDDQAILFPDGWIATAYADPYRVEWRDRNARRIKGPSLPFARVRVDEFQKRATIARGWPGDAALFASSDFPPWPDVLPPFLSEALLPSPDGSLVIRRTPDGRRPESTYDVVNRQGLLTHQVVLKPNQRLVGFGRNAAYAVSRDEDGIETIERYRWPPPPAR